MFGLNWTQVRPAGRTHLIPERSEHVASVMFFYFDVLWM